MTTQTLLILVILAIVFLGSTPWVAPRYYPETYNRGAHVSVIGIVLVLVVLRLLHLI